MTVVMASEGYPGHYERDRVITTSTKPSGCPTSRSSTPALPSHRPAARPRRPVVTDGGRVLDVTALGETLVDAQARAYEAARADPFHGGGIAATSPIAHPAPAAEVVLKSRPGPRRRRRKQRPHAEP